MLKDNNNLDNFNKVSPRDDLEAPTLRNDDLNNFDKMRPNNRKVSMLMAKINESKANKAKDIVIAPKTKPYIAEGKYEAIITNATQETRIYGDREALAIKVTFAIIQNGRENIPLT